MRWNKVNTKPKGRTPEERFNGERGLDAAETSRASGRRIKMFLDIPFYRTALHVSLANPAATRLETYAKAIYQQLEKASQSPDRRPLVNNQRVRCATMNSKHPGYHMCELPVSQPCDRRWLRVE